MLLSDWSAKAHKTCGCSYRPMDRYSELSSKHSDGRNESSQILRHYSHTHTLTFTQEVNIFMNLYIYIYAFNRRFYPKRLTVHSGYTFVLSVCVFPWNRTHNLCAANAMLYHWATGTCICMKLVSLWACPAIGEFSFYFCGPQMLAKSDLHTYTLDWCQVTALCYY